MADFTFADFMQLLINALYDGSIYAVVGLGFMVIYRTTHILNFAQGDFLMLGGVMMITLYSVTGMNYVLCMILTLALIVLLGLFVERFGYRIFVEKKASLFVQSFATIGLSMILQCAVLVIYGHEPLTLDSFTGDNPIDFMGAAVSSQSIWAVGIAIAIFIAAKIFFDYTKMGKAMRAAADNPEGAAVVGIENSKMSKYAFAMSAGVCGLIGIAITPIYYTSYDVGTLFTVKGFIAAVIGGMYNPLGAVMGGLTLGLLENFGAGLISSGYKDMIALFVLIIVLLVRSSRISKAEA